MSRFVLKTIMAIIIACYSLAFFCGCESAEENKIEGGDIVTQLLLNSEFSGAKLFEKTEGKFLSAGGKTFENGFTLLNSGSDTAFLSLNVNGKYKKINFWLGPLEKNGGHRLSESVLIVTVDGETCLTQKITRNNAAGFFSLDIFGSSTVTFSASDTTFDIVVGNISFGDEESKADNEETIAKLVKDIPPYFYSAKDRLEIIRSADDEKCKVCGSEYTDVLKACMPNLVETEDEIYAYFNLEGKYKKLTFSVGGVDDYMYESYDEHLYSDKELPVKKAKLTIYADEKIVFSKDIYPTTIQEFTVDVNNCKSLGIIWESYPQTEIFYMGMVNAFVQK